MTKKERFMLFLLKVLRFLHFLFFIITIVIVLSGLFSNVNEVRNLCFTILICVLMSRVFGKIFDNIRSSELDRLYNEFKNKAIKMMEKERKAQEERKAHKEGDEVVPGITLKKKCEEDKVINEL